MLQNKKQMGKIMVDRAGVFHDGPNACGVKDYQILCCNSCSLQLFEEVESFRHFS